MASATRRCVAVRSKDRENGQQWILLHSPLLRRPGTSTLPWGYKIFPELGAIITGQVAERGMAWWQNGQARPWNAPHLISPDYQFHGTLGPVWWGDDIDYNDFFVFRVNVGGQTGTASLTIAGTVNVRQ